MVVVTTQMILRQVFHQKKEGKVHLKERQSVKRETKGEFQSRNENLTTATMTQTVITKEANQRHHVK